MINMIRKFENKLWNYRKCVFLYRHLKKFCWSLNYGQQTDYDVANYKDYLKISKYLRSVTSELPFIGQVEELLLGAVDVILRPPDDDLVALAIRAGEFYGNTSTIFHNGVDQLPFSTDKGIVKFGGDGDLFTDDILELVLDLADLLPCLLYVFPLSRDGDDVILIALGGKVNFCVCLFTDLTNIGTS